MSVRTVYALVLSRLVLSRLVLSSLLLSCLVLSCLVLSCLVLSCLVLSCLVLSCLVLSCLVLSCLVLSCLVLSCLVVCVCVGVRVCWRAAHSPQFPSAVSLRVVRALVPIVCCTWVTCRAHGLVSNISSSRCLKATMCLVSVASRCVSTWIHICTCLDALTVVSLELPIHVLVLNNARVKSED